MSIVWLEDLMYQVSGAFLAPVLFLLVVLFAYAFAAFGGFVMQAWQRKHDAAVYRAALAVLPHKPGQMPAGYPLLMQFSQDTTMNQDELDVAALKNLELVRIVSRTAPMLGLIATMIPMGPALKSLSNGNIQGISDSLIVAFSAVIFGLVIASITFLIASYKKRWLALELVALAKIIEENKNRQQNDSAIIKAENTEKFVEATAVELNFGKPELAQKGAST